MFVGAEAGGVVLSAKGHVYRGRLWVARGGPGRAQHTHVSIHSGERVTLAWLLAAGETRAHGWRPLVPMERGEADTPTVEGKVWGSGGSTDSPGPLSRRGTGPWPPPGCSPLCRA